MVTSKIPLKYQLDYYDYSIPENQIAFYPSQKRTASKLLVIDRKHSKFYFHQNFTEIESYLRRGDLLVLNDTKVFPARLKVFKKSGGKVEVLLFKKPEGSFFEGTALLKGKRLKTGEVLFSRDKEIELKILEPLGEGKFRIELKSERESLDKLVEKIGLTPLPPYIKREPEEKDFESYQTVYAKKEGSIAAPTAGFHFDVPLLEKLKEKGVIITFITLHIGYATFAPIKVSDIRDHKIEPEYIEVSEEAVEEVKRALKEKRRVIAVGTTVTRTLEFLARQGFKSYSGPCDLYIYPDFEFQVVSALITNFHLPKSSPLLLVCAFAGRDLIFKAYEEAIKRGYRFYSYGDATFVF